MQHKGFADMPCPIARSLERVGEWWSILILRDAFKGKSRFDQFQKSLGIAPNMLTRRLNDLVDAGLLERRRYSLRPPRYEYLVTARASSSSTASPAKPSIRSWSILRPASPSASRTTRSRRAQPRASGPGCAM